MLAELRLPKLDYIARVTALHAVGRYADGYRAFLEAEGEEAADVAVAPLAIPMLAGPAALSTVAVLMAQAQPDEVPLVFLAIALTGLHRGVIGFDEAVEIYRP